MADERQALIEEAKRIEEFALWNASSHFVTAAIAGWIQNIVGVVPIILGALGTWKYLADPAKATPGGLWWASIFSLSAGVVGSILGYWNLGKTRVEHFIAAAKYKTLENEARRAHELHVLMDDDGAFRGRVLELGRRYDQLGESSPQSLTWAFRIAAWGIRKGRFKSDAQPQSQPHGPL